MTEPLTPPGCDLRDFPHTPLFRARLFGSSFHARANDAEWRAGVTLWLKSWDQVPAGSLPDDDVELCRLAELARDIKTWKRVRDGALRGWFVCSDGRLYHPVVAEGINNAIEKKAAQRAKTLKARIAGAEKRLKEAKTPAEKAHVTEELEKLKQSLSQTIPKPVTDNVTGSKRREGEGEGEGNSSEAIASAGKPASDLTREELWEAGKSLLVSAGVPKGQCGSFVGGLVKRWGEAVVVDAVRSAVVAVPPEPREYLTATCQRLAGERQDPPKPITVPSNAAEQTAAYLAAQEMTADEKAKAEEARKAVMAARKPANKEPA